MVTATAKEKETKTPAMISEIPTSYVNTLTEGNEEFLEIRVSNQATKEIITELYERIYNW